MPAKQRGSVVKRGKTWQARWYDEDGNRHARAAASRPRRLRQSGSSRE
jgi:hypothetical protein